MPLSTARITRVTLYRGTIYHSPSVSPFVFYFYAIKLLPLEDHFESITPVHRRPVDVVLASRLLRVIHTLLRIGLMAARKGEFLFSDRSFRSIRTRIVRVFLKDDGF